MRKRTLGVVLLAGLAMSGAGAFTGSNAMPAGSDTRVAGYGAVTATGVTVTDVDYNLLATDESKMDSIVFITTGTNLTSLTSHLSLRDGAGTTTSEMDCVNSQTAAQLLLGLTADWTITCDLSGNPALSSFDTVGLTVYTPNA